MGLDINKCKISNVKSNCYITRTITEICENKSIKDLYNKFQQYVKTSTEKFIDVEETKKKFGLSDEWDITGFSFTENDDFISFGRGENDNYESTDFNYNDAVLKNEKVYTLYYNEIGYQRKDCKSEIYTDIFGTDYIDDPKAYYYALSIVTDNSVLDLVKTYANDGTALSTWTLEDDEFVIFDF